MVSAHRTTRFFGKVTAQEELRTLLEKTDENVRYMRMEVEVQNIQGILRKMGIKKNNTFLGRNILLKQNKL